jgi:hypothetical protein
MYSKEFLQSLGLDPALFDPDCESASTNVSCGCIVCDLDVLTF